MPYGELMSERLTVLAVIHPDLHLGTYFTPWINMAGYQRALALLDVGDITATGTVDLELQEAQDSAGTGAIAIATKTITQLTQAGGDGEDVCEINLRGEEMDADNRFCYVRARLDVLVASANAQFYLLGESPTYVPVPLTLITEEIQ